MTTPKTILLEVNSRHEDRPQFELAAADALIKPGHLLELTSANKVDGHTGDGTFAPKWVAVEHPYHDPRYVATAAIDTAYTADDSVRIVRAQPGDKLYMWLADEENAAVGSPLASNGNGGELKVGTPATEAIVAVAAEAVNNVGGSGAVRISAIIV